MVRTRISRVGTVYMKLRNKIKARHILLTGRSVTDAKISNIIAKLALENDDIQKAIRI